MKFGEYIDKIEEAKIINFQDYKKKKSSAKGSLSMDVEEPKDINKAVTMLIKGAQKKIDDDYKKSFPNLTPTKLGIEKGKRYIKITATTDGGKGQKSVWAFIDTKEDPKLFGNIYKPASWNAPAKHARGNVFDGSWGVNSVGVYGPAYLR